MTQNTSVLPPRYFSPQDRDFQQITSNLRSKGFRLQECGGNAIRGWLIFPIEGGLNVAKLQHIQGEWLLSIHSAHTDYSALFDCLPNDECYVYSEICEGRVGVVSSPDQAQLDSEREISDGMPAPVPGAGIPKSDATDLGKEYWGVGSSVSVREEVEHLKGGIESLANRDFSVLDPTQICCLWDAAELLARVLL